MAHDPYLPYLAAKSQKLRRCLKARILLTGNQCSGHVTLAFAVHDSSLLSGFGSGNLIARQQHVSHAMHVRLAIRLKTQQRLPAIASTNCN